MKLKHLISSFCLLASLLARADEAIYSIQLTTTPHLTIQSEYKKLSLSPLSENASKALNRTKTRKIIAADYASEILIKTTEPNMALQDILGQITEQTGLMLSAVMNTTLDKIAPVATLQGLSDTSVINLLLTPKEPDLYILTCSYAIFTRSEGSIDGTPAAITQMNAMRQKMNADSVAPELPKAFRKDGFKFDDYYRGGLGAAITDPMGKNPVGLITLHLKAGDKYTLGVYLERSGVWSMIDEPINLMGFGPAGVYGKNGLLSLRCRKLGGGSGLDIFIENGHLIKVPYTE